MEAGKNGGEGENVPASATSSASSTAPAKKRRRRRRSGTGFNHNSKYKKQKAARKAAEEQDRVRKARRSYEENCSHEKLFLLGQANQRGWRRERSRDPRRLPRYRRVKKNMAEAARLYELAADRGNVCALVALGDLYGAGLGVERDLSKAAQMYQLAVTKDGNPEAQNKLGACYENGRGVDTDLEWAALLYAAAADDPPERGGRPSHHALLGMFNVARLLETFFGDLEDAAKFYAKAGLNHKEARDAYVELATRRPLTFLLKPPPKWWLPPPPTPPPTPPPPPMVRDVGGVVLQCVCLCPVCNKASDKMNAKAAACAPCTP